MISKNVPPEKIAGKAPAHAAKTVSILLKICISAAVIFFLLSRIKPSQILATLQAYPVSSLYTPIILYLLFGLWASMKWKILLPHARFGPLVRVSFTRYFYAMIALGVVTGDLARAYLLVKKEKERAAAITASVIVDRVTGFIGLTLMGIAGIAAASIKIPVSLSILCAAGVFIFPAALFFLRTTASYALALNLIYAVAGKMRPLQGLAGALLRCLDALHGYAQRSRLMLLSIAAGVVSQVILITAIALLGSGLGLKVAFWDWCWIFCVVSMTVLIPVTISGLGIREGSFVALLSLLGIGAEKAMALSLLVFCLDIVLGAIGWLCQFRLSGEGRGAYFPNA